MVTQEEIVKTETKIKNGIEYVYYHINRPARPGDPMGGSQGTVIDGKIATTKVEFYVYCSEG